MTPPDAVFILETQVEQQVYYTIRRFAIKVDMTSLPDIQSQVSCFVIYLI